MCEISMRIVPTIFDIGSSPDDIELIRTGVNLEILSKGKRVALLSGVHKNIIRKSSWREGVIDIREEEKDGELGEILCTIINQKDEKEKRIVYQFVNNDKNINVLLEIGAEPDVVYELLQQFYKENQGIRIGSGIGVDEWKNFLRERGIFADYISGPRLLNFGQEE